MAIDEKPAFYVECSSEFGSKSFRDDWNDNRFVLHNYTVADQHHGAMAFNQYTHFNGMLFSSSQLQK